jgi:addiction module RelE/StbE family toxin
VLLRSSEFKKKYNALHSKLQAKTNIRLGIFIMNEFDSILNNHLLHGEYEGCRSINVTGNVRLIYKKINDELFYLVNIGTHSQLYE